MALTRSYVHRGGEAALLGKTVDGALLDIVGRFGDREALVAIPQETRLTYGQLDGRVDEVARALLATGVGKGDRVGVWATDTVEWLLLQLATARVGAVLVNINPAYRVSELRHALRLAEVNFVFLMRAFRRSDYVRMLVELVPELSSGGDRVESHLFPHLHGAVVFEPGDPGLRERPAPGLITWAEFLERAGTVEDGAIESRRASLDPDDPINVQFTSGTTGFPKAVVLTHHNIVNNAYFIGRAMDFSERDRLCVPVPFYHCFGMVVSNLACLTHGACIVIPADHFEPGATLRAIQEERCTAIHGVPTMFAAELNHEEFATFDLSSLRTGIMAGAPCPPELMRRVREDMGCEQILIGYGQTEAAPIATLTRPTDSVERRLRTVGAPIEHQEIKILDHESGLVCPIGTAGEVCIRGYNVMRGYYAQPHETAQAIDEAGWLHTGDLGVMDPDGYVSITGRLKDMIIRGGENIYPAEIEAFLFEHPDIDQVAVLGVPHPEYGEEVGAWVRLRDGAELDADTLRDWARERIAHFKIPAHIWFVGSFPMTVTGKIQKNRMGDAVRRWQEAGGDRAPERVDEYAAIPPARDP